MPALLHAALAWLSAHPYQVVLAAYAVVAAVVAHLPPKVAGMPFVGLLVRFADRLSVLTHAQDSGTLKWPGVASLAFEAALSALRKP
jgi:hypothetical protein